MTYCTSVHCGNVLLLSVHFGQSTAAVVRRNVLLYIVATECCCLCILVGLRWHNVNVQQHSSYLLTPTRASVHAFMYPGRSLILFSAQGFPRVEALPETAEGDGVSVDINDRVGGGYYNNFMQNGERG